MGIKVCLKNYHSLKAQRSQKRKKIKIKIKLQIITPTIAKHE